MKCKLHDIEITTCGSKSYATGRTIVSIVRTDFRFPRSTPYASYTYCIT